MLTKKFLDEGGTKILIKKIKEQDKTAFAAIGVCQSPASGTPFCNSVKIINNAAYDLGEVVSLTSPNTTGLLQNNTKFAVPRDGEIVAVRFTDGCTFKDWNGAIAPIFMSATETWQFFYPVPSVSNVGGPAPAYPDGVFIGSGRLKSTDTPVNLLSAIPICYKGKIIGITSFDASTSGPDANVVNGVKGSTTYLMYDATGIDYTKDGTTKYKGPVWRWMGVDYNKNTRYFFENRFGNILQTSPIVIELTGTDSRNLTAEYVLPWKRFLKWDDETQQAVFKSSLCVFGDIKSISDLKNHLTNNRAANPVFCKYNDEFYTLRNWDINDSYVECIFVNLHLDSNQARQIVISGLSSNGEDSWAMGESTMTLPSSITTTEINNVLNS